MRQKTIDVLVKEPAAISDMNAGLAATAPTTNTAAAAHPMERPAGMGPQTTDHWTQFVQTIRFGFSSAVSGAAELPRGFTEQQLKERLAPYEQASFIILKGFGPGEDPELRDIGWRQKTVAACWPLI